MGPSMPYDTGPLDFLHRPIQFCIHVYVYQGLRQFRLGIETSAHLKVRCIWSYGVTVSTLDSESSDRGSNPRRTCYASQLERWIHGHLQLVIIMNRLGRRCPGTVRKLHAKQVLEMNTQHIPRAGHCPLPLLITMSRNIQTSGAKHRDRKTAPICSKLAQACHTTGGHSILSV